MEDELDMMQKSVKQQLIDRARNREMIGVKWIFNTKLNINEKIYKHKLDWQ